MNPTRRKPTAAAPPEPVRAPRNAARPRPSQPGPRITPVTNRGTRQTETPRSRALTEWLTTAGHHGHKPNRPDTNRNPAPSAVPDAETHPSQPLRRPHRVAHPESPPQNDQRGETDMNPTRCTPTATALPGPVRAPRKAAHPRPSRPGPRITPVTNRGTSQAEASRPVRLPQPRLRRLSPGRPQPAGIADGNPTGWIKTTNGRIAPGRTPRPEAAGAGRRI